MCAIFDYRMSVDAVEPDIGNKQQIKAFAWKIDYISSYIKLYK